MNSIVEKISHDFTPKYKRNQVKTSVDLKGVSVRGFPTDILDTDLVLSLEEGGMPRRHQKYSIITQTECRAQPQTCGIELNFFKILS